MNEIFHTRIVFIDKTVDTSRFLCFRFEDSSAYIKTQKFQTLKFWTINFGQKGQFESKIVRNIWELQDNFGHLFEISASPNFNGPIFLVFLMYYHL